MYSIEAQYNAFDVEYSTRHIGMFKRFIRIYKVFRKKRKLNIRRTAKYLAYSRDIYYSNKLIERRRAYKKFKRMAIIN